LVSQVDWLSSLSWYSTRATHWYWMVSKKEGKAFRHSFLVACPARIMLTCVDTSHSVFLLCSTNILWPIQRSSHRLWSVRYLASLLCLLHWKPIYFLDFVVSTEYYDHSLENIFPPFLKLQAFWRWLTRMMTSVLLRYPFLHWQLIP
jgi:hypothetical protein